MCCRSFACLMLSLLVHVAVSDSPARAADKPGIKEDDIVRQNVPSSPKELEARLAKLLSASTRTELDRLVSVSDYTDAIAAGWERVRRTMPETEGKDVFSPDLLAISRFLGLIEGRIRVPVPKAWEENVKSAAGYGQKKIWFPRSDLVLVERAFTSWSVARAADHWIVTKGSQLIKIPAEDDMGPVRYAAVEHAGERAYVALYGSPSQYRLFAIDQGTGKVLWSSAVWASSKVWAGNTLILGGPDWHVVTMRSSDEMLVVFGFSGSAVYIEAFDRKTGENRCRFSTAYFDAVSLPK